MSFNLSEYLFNKENDPLNIFSKLTGEQRTQLDASAAQKSLKKNQLIFEQGSHPEGLIYLTRGSAKVYMVGTGDREQIVRLVKPLSFVGYKALFAEKKHATNARAIDESEVVIYNRVVLNTIIDQNPAFAKEIIKALANELGFNYKRIINLTQKHIQGRLAETLLLIKDMYGFDTDGKTLKAHFTRENIAHFSNMTTSNAIRTLKKFNDEGLIRAEGKNIILMNIPELERISITG